MNLDPYLFIETLQISKLEPMAQPQDLAVITQKPGA
jgi:hypothetical protein